jgi:hypothetical protein
MDHLIQLITYFAVTSVAAERVTDILKRVHLAKIEVPGVVYQIIAGIVGGLLCYASPPEFTFLKLNEYVLIVVVALATSGGSGMWHDMLTSLNNYSKSSKAS